MKYYVLEMHCTHDRPQYLRYWRGTNMYTNFREKAKKFRDRKFCEQLKKQYDNKYNKIYTDRNGRVLTKSWCVIRCTDEFDVEDIIK